MSLYVLLHNSSWLQHIQHNYTHTLLTSSLHAFLLHCENNIVTYMRILASKFHHILPVSIDSREESTFLRHLLVDVFRWENRFQIEPLSLHLQPLVYRLLDTDQSVLPFLYICKCDKLFFVLAFEMVSRNVTFCENDLVNCSTSCLLMGSMFMLMSMFIIYKDFNKLDSKKDINTMAEVLLVALAFISFSKGLINGDPRIVCVLTIWSSTIVWISSTDARIDTPVSRYTVVLKIMSSHSSIILEWAFSSEYSLEAKR